MVPSMSAMGCVKWSKVLMRSSERALGFPCRVEFVEVPAQSVDASSPFCDKEFPIVCE